MEKIITVSQVNSIIKDLIDGHSELTGINVQGEISNHKVYQSGHHYFSMKDSDGVLRCVMFKGSASQLGFQPQNGMEVIAFGRVSVFVRDGSYQMYVERLVPSGAGALNIQFEQLKQELGRRGLFDPQHKKRLPRFPKTIGVVTSGSGAAIHDILRVTSARWPNAKICVLPVQVQGKNAGLGIARAIEYADRWKIADVLIVGRGGGSMEDLWCFNDERVAYAIYNANTPIISAVGHEPDVTISDYVADVRAATPSNGAEIAVPDKRDVLRYLENLKNKMDRGMAQEIANARAALKMIAPQPPMLAIREKQMELDRIQSVMDKSIEQCVVQKKMLLANIANSPAFSNPLKPIEDIRMKLNVELKSSMDAGIRMSFDQLKSNLATLEKNLYQGHPLVKVREIRVKAEAQREQLDMAINAELKRLFLQLNSISLSAPDLIAERKRLEQAHRNLDAAAENMLARNRNGLDIAVAKLASANPLKPLENGFAYVTTNDGTPIRAVDDVKCGDYIRIQVADGVINCIVSP